jgi:hypothetical protein
VKAGLIGSLMSDRTPASTPRRQDAKGGRPKPPDPARLCAMKKGASRPARAGGFAGAREVYDLSWRPGVLAFQTERIDRSLMALGGTDPKA